MDTISPVVVDAFRLLRTDLYRHLDQAEFLAGSWDVWSDRDTDTVRELIGDLVHIVRQLLREHDVQDSGDCLICAASWPCRVVTTVHTQVTDPQRRLSVLTDRADQ